jgi:hypothetical protein
MLSSEEKRKIYDEYFTKDNIILKSLADKKRCNSVVDDHVTNNNGWVFEVLELQGPELIRFAMSRLKDCTCKSAITEERDMINLRNMLNERYPVSEYPE